MTIQRRILMQAAAVALGAPIGLQTARFSAGPWPTKPVKLIMPFPPGAGIDAAAGDLGDRLQEVRRQLRRRVLPDHRATGDPPYRQRLCAGERGPVRVRDAVRTQRRPGGLPVRDFCGRQAAHYAIRWGGTQLRRRRRHGDPEKRFASAEALSRRQCDERPLPSATA
jgi:hypothetical protein